MTASDHIHPVKKVGMGLEPFQFELLGLRLG
jgi:hypothetical protein